MKTLMRATFIAMNFAEVDSAYPHKDDYVGLMTFEEWSAEYADLLVQIYHAVL